MKNTFDFFNYNYSALISIFAALMGMAYPLILQAVQRVDDMYQSTVLAKYVHQQSTFRQFNIVLVISIVVSLIAPFVIACYTTKVNYALCIEAIHTIVITVLVFSAIRLFRFILKTTRPSDFLRYIISNHSEQNPALVEIFQVAKYASNHEDINLFTRSMNFIRTSSAMFFKRYANQVDEQSPFYLQYIDVMEDLKKQLSKTESGYFETYDQLVSIYYGDRKFSEIGNLSYQQIWNTLDLISYKEKKEYFKRYWRGAESYFCYNTDTNYKPLYSEDTKAIETFREFHFMLGAMLVYRKQWNLLSQILMPVEVERSETLLVPTRLAAILSISESLLSQNAPGRELSFRFSMKGMEEYRYKEELITHAILRYTSLLIIRLWLVGQYYHRDLWALSIPNTEKFNADRLQQRLYLLNRIKEEINAWFNNDNIETLRILVPKTVPQKTIIEKIDESRQDVIGNLKKQNVTSGTSEKKIDLLKSALIREVQDKDTLLPMSEQAAYLKDEDTPEIICGFYGVTVEQSAIDEDVAGSPISIASFVINRLSSQLWSGYRRKFVLESPHKKYHIYIKEFFDALDRLGVNNKYAVLLSYLSPEYICLHYADATNPVTKVDGRYFYNGAPIYSYPFDNKYRAIVVSRDVLPYVEIWQGEGEADDMTELSRDLQLYSNADVLNAKEESKRLLKVARNYKVHTTSGFMRYVELDFIMNTGLPSQIDSITSF